MAYITFQNITGFSVPFDGRIQAQRGFSSLAEAKVSVPKGADCVVFVNGKVGSYRVFSGSSAEEIVYPAQEGKVYYYGGTANAPVSAADATSWVDPSDGNKVKYGSSLYSAKPDSWDVIKVAQLGKYKIDGPGQYTLCHGITTDEWKNSVALKHKNGGEGSMYIEYEMPNEPGPAHIAYLPINNGRTTVNMGYYNTTRAFDH